MHMVSNTKDKTRSMTTKGCACPIPVPLTAVSVTTPLPSTMNSLLVLLACMVTVSLAMSTSTHKPHHHHSGSTHPHHHHSGSTHAHHHHSHATHPPHVGEGFAFKYDRTSHRMAVVSSRQCWIYATSDSERMTITTDVHALRMLEVKLIQLVDNNPNAMAMTHSDLSLMSPFLAHVCHVGWPIMALN